MTEKKEDSALQIIEEATCSFGAFGDVNQFIMLHQYHAPILNGNTERYHLIARTDVRE